MPATDRWWAFAVALAVIGLDRLTKVIVQGHMSAFDAITVVRGWIRIVHTENTGAAFGVLADGNAALRAIILIGVSGLVIAFVAFALWGRAPAYSGIATRLGLSFVLGGAAGNLYDRVVHGSVTDFLEVYHGLWSFPAFNAADSAITVGAALLLFGQMRSRSKTGAESPAGPAIGQQ